MFTCLLSFHGSSSLFISSSCDPSKPVHYLFLCSIPNCSILCRPCPHPASLAVLDINFFACFTHFCFWLLFLQRHGNHYHIYESFLAVSYSRHMRKTSSWNVLSCKITWSSFLFFFLLAFLPKNCNVSIILLHALFSGFFLFFKAINFLDLQWSIHVNHVALIPFIVPTDLGSIMDEKCMSMHKNLQWLVW